MTPADTNPAFLAWLAARPPAVQDVGRRFPVGTVLTVHGRPAHVVSYPETRSGAAWLGVSYIDPAVDYHRAVAERFTICPCCLEEHHHQPEETPS